MKISIIGYNESHFAVAHFLGLDNSKPSPNLFMPFPDPFVFPTPLPAKLGP
jgi:hypothetical protein